MNAKESNSKQFLVNAVPLLRSPGNFKELTLNVALDGRWQLISAQTKVNSLEADLRLEAFGESIEVTGQVKLFFSGTCRRCLNDLDGEGELEIREVFEQQENEGETYHFDGQIVDLQDMLREACLLAVPVAPLCSSACQGPVPEVFETELEQSPAKDPRWAALDGLFGDSQS